MEWKYSTILTAQEGQKEATQTPIIKITQQSWGMGMMKQGEQGWGMGMMEMMEVKRPLKSQEGHNLLYKIKTDLFK